MSPQRDEASAHKYAEDFVRTPEEEGKIIYTIYIGDEMVAKGRAEDVIPRVDRFIIDGGDYVVVNRVYARRDA